LVLLQLDGFRQISHRYVEIGNEGNEKTTHLFTSLTFLTDLYRTAPQSYLAYRWAAFANAISAKYPQLKLISTTNYGVALNPTPKYVDIHHYEVRYPLQSTWIFA
jgi:hypothetical protein